LAIVSTDPVYTENSLECVDLSIRTICAILTITFMANRSIIRVRERVGCGVRMYVIILRPFVDVKSTLKC